MKKFNAPFIFLALLVGSIAVLSHAQTPQGLSGKNISFALRDKKTSKLLAILTGENIKQITGSQVLITKFGMKTFRNSDTNQVEVIAAAPECLYDRSRDEASSAGPIKAYTATTNLYIEGQGFFLRQSNAVLIISNDVQTLIRKDLLQSSSKKNSTELLTSSSSATNQNLKITSDHFQFLYESNLIIYAGNVRVDDAQMTLTCDALNIFLTTNKTVERITAENRVVILNKQDKSRATGERAIYIINTNQELVELIGNPSWSSGQRQGKADIFVFDRRNNIFSARTNAVFKLPREEIGQPDLLNLGAANTTNAATGKIVEISADTIAFKLPETNNPVRQIIAERNVVISSESDNSRATAEKVTYNEASGMVELTGNPVWKIAETEIKAGRLAVGRTNQFFSAKTNIYLKLPAKLFGKSLQTAGTTNTSALTNRWVEVFCDDLLYATNSARLDGNVRANLLNENGSQIALLCGSTKFSFGPSNQVETVLAEKNVVLQEIPNAALQTNLLKRTITCETLALKRSLKTGLLESIHAETNVVGEEIKKTKSGTELKRISAEIVDVKFSPTTNQVESVIAEKNILAEKIERIGTTNKTVQAAGQKGVYRLTAQEESVELIGEPSAWTDSILLSEAKLVRWNLKTGKIGAIPYKVTPLNSTNKIDLPRIPKRP